MIKRSLLPRLISLLVGLGIFAICVTLDIPAIYPWFGFGLLGIVVGLVEVGLSAEDHRVALTVPNGRRLVTANHLADEFARVLKQIIVVTIATYAYIQQGGATSAGVWSVATVGLSLIPLIILTTQMGGIYYRIEATRVLNLATGSDIQGAEVELHEQGIAVRPWLWGVLMVMALIVVLVIGSRLIQWFA